jgi:hypothetical protein
MDSLHYPNAYRILFSNSILQLNAPPEASPKQYRMFALRLAWTLTRGDIPLPSTGTIHPHRPSNGKPLGSSLGGPATRSPGLPGPQYLCPNPCWCIVQTAPVTILPCLAQGAKHQLSGAHISEKAYVEATPATHKSGCPCSFPAPCGPPTLTPPAFPSYLLIASSCCPISSAKSTRELPPPHCLYMPSSPPMVPPSERLLSSSLAPPEPPSDCKYFPPSD